MEKREGQQPETVCVEPCPSETALEEAYLRETLEVGEKQLAQARKTMEKQQSEMIEAKKELRENTEHGFMNLYSSGDFEALVELSQSMAPVTNLAAECDDLAKKIRRLEGFLKSPYFARIDFCFEGEQEPEKIYIGRTSLAEHSSALIYVYDWRSPVASVFYRFMTGEAYYDAPAGRITGNLERKRQFEIKDGRLNYFFDTDLNINDEILRQMLSQNRTPKMKAIVETIQKEQDIVIRNMENDLLMIQGAAGSGKTSIALHRAAYLMYQGLQSRLSAGNIMVLSPNGMFEQYISNVLPELGEENVVSGVLEDILQSFLRDKKVETRDAFLEKALGEGPGATMAKKSMRYKTSEEFVRILDRFAADIPRRGIDWQEVRFQGRCIASGEQVKEWVLRHEEVPLGARLEQAQKRILDAAVQDSGRKLSGQDKGILLQEVQSFLTLSLFRQYRRLWAEDMYFCSDDPDMRRLRAYTLHNLKGDTLCFDDAAAILYLHLKIYGSRTYQEIRQVIIDEAQDYGPLHYEIFRMLFSQAKFTVLGDINQTIGKEEDIGFYERVGRILNRKNASLVTLVKSFRCTSEILQFSLKFMDQGTEIQCFNRSGDQVEVRAFGTHEAYLEGIVREAECCREKGFETVCLLCKTEKNCGMLYRELQPRMDIRRGGAEGTLIMPSYMAKGLEFDAVIICDGDARTYSCPEDRKILYVECTRALHRLSVFCEGEMTALAEISVREK